MKVFYSKFAIYVCFWHQMESAGILSSEFLIQN